LKGLLKWKNGFKQFLQGFVMGGGGGWGCGGKGAQVLAMGFFKRPFKRYLKGFLKGPRSCPWAF
jgi:hypothetical protein